MVNISAESVVNMLAVFDLRFLLICVVHSMPFYIVFVLNCFPIFSDFCVSFSVIDAVTDAIVTFYTIFNVSYPF